MFRNVSSIQCFSVPKRKLSLQISKFARCYVGNIYEDWVVPIDKIKRSKITFIDQRFLLLTNK